jgi:hypothetical protein
MRGDLSSPSMRCSNSDCTTSDQAGEVLAKLMYFMYYKPQTYQTSTHPK